MIKTPQNLKLLTNVAVVRLKKGGKKFELACYHNKVLNWRSKQEGNINEVLQIDKIFSDVGKGEFAKKKDMTNAFGNLTEEQIIMEILNKGEFQVSDKERESQLENLKLDIANIIVKMTVNETDGNKFPVSIILKAMNEVNCKVNGNKPAKPQALAFIPELKKVIPIERSRMQLRITFRDSEQAQKLLEVLNSKFSSQFSMTSNRQQEGSAVCVVELSADPSLFREISQITKQEKEVYSDVTLEIIDSQIEETKQ